MDHGDSTRKPGVASHPDALVVVVIDDDESYRARAAEPFRKRGDIVHAAADGLEALAVCLEHPPDIILSDVQMPRMDGWQFLRLIRARPALANVPVIFLTSLSGDPERLLGYQLGVDGYIPKPYTPEELLVRVHQILRRAGQKDEALALPPTLRGELEHVAPTSLLSFLEIEKKSGELVIVGDAVVRFFIASGRLVRAELEGDDTQSLEDILSSALDWTVGQFEFSPREITVPDDSETTSITKLVLDHARQSDEKRASLNAAARKKP